MNVHYRGYKIDAAGDQYEVFQGKKLVATGFGYDDPLANAKQIVDKEFVTPLLLVLRQVKEAEALALRERTDGETMGQ